MYIVSLKSMMFYASFFSLSPFVEATEIIPNITGDEYAEEIDGIGGDFQSNHESEDNHSSEHKHIESHDNHAGVDTHEQEHGHEHGHGEEEIIVRATRSGRRVQDEPIRVEVIPQEEVLEKALMRPGNIAMIVAETGGIRVQVTSPALGAANIRIQGLYGRYSQLLADGLPLYGGQASSIGLLQIPPTDLGQVEIIKGAASSLYGGSALGGVINLVSRRPGDEAESELLFNATSRNGQDLTFYTESPLGESLAASLTAGAHRQSSVEFDGDGWIDIPSYKRFTARPRIFWENGDGASLYGTIGFLTEERQGGTLAGEVVPDGNPFPQNQDTDRIDVGLIGELPLSAALTGQLRASVMHQEHDHIFGELLEEDRHESFLLEGSLSGEGTNFNWVTGIAFQSDKYTSDTFPDFNYTYDVPGVFAQIDYDLSDELSVAASGRFDDHNEYGSQTSPRLSLLYRPGPWTIRSSYGEGYFAPTPFIEEIEAAGLSRLEPLENIQAETAETASLDIGYQEGRFETSLTIFNSRVSGVTQLSSFASVAGGIDDRVRLVNLNGTTEITGSEVLLRYVWRNFKITGSYLYLNSSESELEGEGRTEVELTPKHSAGFVAMWERHGEFRLGYELYYTGTQRVEDSPFRTRGDAYIDMGILGEITRGRFSYFINAENILDVRQTKEEPLLLPVRAADGQWTTDIWSRNDGFIVNAGVRYKW